jgi:hypothetical protein
LNFYLVGVGQFYDSDVDKLSGTETNDAPSYRRAVSIQSGIRVETGFRRSEAVNATIVLDNSGSALNKLAIRMFADAQIRRDGNLLLSGSVDRITITDRVIRLVVVG